MVKEASRASWNYTYEKGLVDTLHDHNNPRFRGQNGWSPNGWRSIVEHFNQKFPDAHFTKQQIQEKEKEMKGNYKAIRDARKQSGTGWDESLGTIIAEPKIWDKIVHDQPKVKKFRSKPFPLFNTLALLYEGSIATGDLSFVSVPQPENTSNLVTLSDNEATDVGLNPFSSTNLDGQGATSTNLEAEEVEHATSASSGQREDTRNKRKQNQIAGETQGESDF